MIGQIEDWLDLWVRCKKYKRVTVLQEACSLSFLASLEAFRVESEPRDSPRGI